MHGWYLRITIAIVSTFMSMSVAMVKFEVYGYKTSVI